LHTSARRATTEKQLFKLVFRQLDFLFKQHVRPSRSVFLGVDGPASFAKLRTQRHRRLLKQTKDKSKGPIAAALPASVSTFPVDDIDGDDDDDTVVAAPSSCSSSSSSSGTAATPTSIPFDSMAITPGTSFMARLHAALEYFIVSRVASDFKFRGVEFFLSGSDVAGEGEVKIVHDLLVRKHQFGERNDSVVIVGSDADLILLALAARAGNVHVLGNSFSDTSFFSVNAWDRQVATLLPHASIDNVRFDFCLLSLLSGNDYLPKLRKSSVPVMWSRYINLKSKKQFADSHIVLPDRTINWPFFAAVLLGPHRADALQRQISGSAAKLAAAPPSAAADDGGVDENEADEFDDDDDDDAIDGLLPGFDCVEFVQGLLWNLSMYASGHCPSVRFYYRFQKAPDATQLVEWMFRTGGAVKLLQDDSRALLPVVCGAALLPPPKHSLLNVGAGMPPLTALEPALADLYARKAGEVDTTVFVDLLERAFERAQSRPLSAEPHAKLFRFNHKDRRPNQRRGERSTLPIASPLPDVPDGQRPYRTPVRVAISVLADVPAVKVLWPSPSARPQRQQQPQAHKQPQQQKKPQQQQQQQQQQRMPPVPIQLLKRELPAPAPVQQQQPQQQPVPVRTELPASLLHLLQPQQQRPQQPPQLPPQPVLEASNPLAQFFPLLVVNNAPVPTPVPTPTPVSTPPQPEQAAPAAARGSRRQPAYVKK